MTMLLLVLSVLSLFVNTATADPAVHSYNVGLYPYIPDTANDGFASLLTALTNKWTQVYPNDAVPNITFIPTATSYDPNALVQYMSGGTYDIAEIDTTLLAYLVDANTISPWSDIGADEWPRANWSAGTYNGENWGVSHWRCSYYSITRSQAVLEAPSVTQYITALNAQTQPTKFRTTLDDYDLDAMWIMGAQQSSSHAVNQASVLGWSPYAHSTLAGNFDTLFNLCQNANGNNPCYNLNIDAIGIFSEQFAANSVGTLTYYSETLSQIFANYSAVVNPNSVNLTLAPLGSSTNPGIGYTDLYVRSTSCTNNANCNSFSNKWKTFITRGDVYAIFLASQDAPVANRVPRFLLPASFTAYSAVQSALQNHPWTGLPQTPLYQRFFNSMMGSLGNAYPIINDGSLISSLDVTYGQLLAYFLAQN